MSDYAKLVQDCEALIRSGEDHKVAKLLSKLNTSKVPRKWRLPLGNIARRSSQIALGLRLLTSVARPTTKTDKAHPAELAEYAILLQRAGSVKEATSILENLSPADVPNVLLLRTFCYFNTWNYEKALPLLEEYLRQRLEPYQTLVARANLASAYVATAQWEKAETFLKETIELAAQSGATRLKGNCHELLSQVYLFTDQLSLADQSLSQAENVFDTTTGLDRLLVDKCRAFYNAKVQGSVEPLLKFQARAQQWPHPETVRETELFILTIKFDEERFNNLYFGTAHEAYRNRIERLLKVNPSQKRFLLGSARAASLSVETGELLDGTQVFPRGSLPHRLISCLTTDFYRPISTNALFAELFPDQYFDIFHSPGRVHQILRRTRQLMAVHKLPIKIVSSELGFKIEVTGELNLEVQVLRPAVQTYDVRLSKLRETLSTPEFKAADVCEILDLTRAAAQRFLAEARHRKDLDTYGAGPATIYFFENKAS